VPPPRRSCLVEDQSYRVRFEFVSEATPGPFPFRVCHRGHRIRLSETVHEIGSSARRDAVCEASCIPRHRRTEAPVDEPTAREVCPDQTSSSKETNQVKRVLMFGMKTVPGVAVVLFWGC
jgi:hypothetical protein